MGEDATWKPIDGYEGYLVSDDGRVWSSKRGIELAQEEKKGYLNVYLYNRDGRKFIGVHRLVAIAFIPNPDNLPEVNHKDENPMNNRVDNLEWCTAKYNSNYGTHSSKLSEQNKGENNPFYGRKHTEDSIERMRAAKHGMPSNNRKTIVVNGKRYVSMSECAKEIGISLTQLHNIKNGKRKNNYNIKFE